ncbi:class I SAM-dependent methyltransferase [Paenibacillus sp. M1]|uniref:Class I SAM-dependent methyltransferase n=1 Tax=Paenibacillus haidiansis TaxID=1574488 RepID=A0ABU7VPS2_9BACL
MHPGDFLQSPEEGYDKAVRQLYRALLSMLNVQNMLEVGCGPGVDYAGAMNTNPNIDYTGLDITPQMIDYCRRNYPEGRFLQGDIHRLPFADNAFQFVYCKDVLNHLDDWKAGFSELYRVSQRFVLVNFFSGLGANSFNQKELRDGYMINFFDWNEVMSEIYSYNPLAITCYPRDSYQEEVSILIQKP